MKVIEVRHVFPIGVHEAFRYITDVQNWAEYWPGFIRIEQAHNARWEAPGDTLTVVLELLRKERFIHMQLERFEADALVTYVTRQTGLPDARHERHFRGVPDGVEYRIVVEFEPRAGIRGLYDRLLVSRGVERAMHKTIANLDRAFARLR